MQTKTAIIINEPIEDMMLGKNTSLSYILAAAKMGHEVYIHNLPERPSEKGYGGRIVPTDPSQVIEVLHLKEEACKLMIEKYQEINKIIMLETLREDYEAVSKIENLSVGDFIKSCKIDNLGTIEMMSSNQFGFGLNRVEPNKAPFPPCEEVDHLKSAFDGMKEIQGYLSHLTLNFPIALIDNEIKELGDKETPQEINRRLAANQQDPIATETAEFTLDGKKFFDAVSSMIAKYRELYPKNQNAKVVLKPKNSAQSLGVFGIEFSTDGGLSLEDLRMIKFEELAKPQFYQIKENLVKEELKEVIDILCCAQRLRDNKNMMSLYGSFYPGKNGNLVNGSAVGEEGKKESVLVAESDRTIQSLSKDLYNAEVLAQPFLEGVRKGDIRANVIRGEDGKLFLAGCTFRSKTKLEGLLVNFSEDGLDLEGLKSKSVDDLKCDLFEANKRISPLYFVKSNLPEAELKQIMDILLYVQEVKGNEKASAETKSTQLGSVVQDEINQVAKVAYIDSKLPKNILEICSNTQDQNAFLQIVKDQNNRFRFDKLTHHVKLSAIKEGAESDQITTCYTTGAAISKPLFVLPKSVQNSVVDRMNLTLDFLNNDPTLSKQYENIMELGVDLIIVDKGDGKRGVLIGEINHYSPAILPISNAMEAATKIRLNKEKKLELIDKYDALAFTTMAIENNLKLQQERRINNRPLAKHHQPFQLS